MGWDLVRNVERMHYFRRFKKLNYKESLCGMVKAPWSRDIPGWLEVNEDMCKTCLGLVGKRRWGHGHVTG